MEVDSEQILCRLCFTHAVEYISIFKNGKPMPNIVNALKQYFHDQVSDTDIYPKVICCECWNRVEAFHEFSQEVIASREQYLQLHLNKVIKDETIEEYIIPNDEPKIQQEMVSVDTFEPIQMEDEDIPDDENPNLRDDGNPKFKEDDYENLKLDEDEQDNSAVVEENVTVDKKPGKIIEVRLPQNINDVTFKQQRQIIDECCDMTCDLCATNFKSFEMAIRHYRVAHNNQPEGYVKCCKMKWTKRAYFYSHIVWHLNPEIFTCHICGKVTRTQQSYERHKLTHLNPDNIFTCDICQAIFSSKNGIEQHILRVHVLKMLFLCHKCDKSFKTEHYLNVHLKLAHPKNLNEKHRNEDDIEFPSDVNVACVKCAATNFSSLSELKTHYSNIHRTNAGVVYCCNQIFDKFAFIRDHIAWHNNPDVFKCLVCDEALPDRKTMHEHYNVHHNTYQCDVCQLSCKSKAELIDHFKTHEKYEVFTTCNECGKMFSSQTSLDAHSKEHETVFDNICEFCAKEFSTHSALKCHIFHMHTDWRKTKSKYECDICRKLFSSEGSMKTHKSKHVSQPQKCVTCGKISANKHALVQHMLGVHGRNNFLCNLCGKQFKTHATHKDHMAWHLNKSYRCKYCEEVFTWRSNMYKHIKSVHEDEWLADKAKKRQNWIHT